MLVAFLRSRQILGQPCCYRRVLTRSPQRSLLTLAIETSCDDTAVAILEKHDGRIRGISPSAAATLHFNKKITADNSVHRGIHPVNAQDSHQKNLAKLISTSLEHLPAASSSNPAEHLPLRVPDDSGTWLSKQKPDFISVTRGPGMRASLSVGLDTAKGLAVAWQVPIVGVHHMQAHALTPRLVSSLSQVKDRAGDKQDVITPSFPFLTLLASGGHTMLLETRSLVDHTIITETSDIAVGDTLDKIGRDILPLEVLATITDGMYARALESFCFPPSDEGSDAPSVRSRYSYVPPQTRGQEYAPTLSPYGWTLYVPFSTGANAGKARSKEFSFTGMGSQVRKICESRGQHISEEERKFLGRNVMRIIFEHIANRIVLALEGRSQQFNAQTISDLVLSGGVASNAYLRHILECYIQTRYTAKTKEVITLLAPPSYLCTDNAAMIAWAGIEMWSAGWRTDLTVQAVRKWSMDPENSDGGILGLPGWSGVKAHSSFS